MQCECCNARTRFMPEAIQQGWVYSYWISDHEEVNCCLCPDCAKSQLRFNPETGDHEWVTTFTITTDDIPSHDLGGEG